MKTVLGTFVVLLALYSRRQKNAKLKNGEGKDWNIKIKQLLDHHNEALEVGEDESMACVCMLINIFF